MTRPSDTSSSFWPRVNHIRFGLSEDKDKVKRGSRFPEPKDLHHYTGVESEMLFLISVS